MSCTKKCGPDCTGCAPCRAKNKPKFGGGSNCAPCKKAMGSSAPKFGGCSSGGCGSGSGGTYGGGMEYGCGPTHSGRNDVVKLSCSAPPTYINNPYYQYADYYVMMNGRNRRILHRCGIEDYYRRRIFEGVNLAPHVHRGQFYSYLITFLKGVYADIIKNQIYHPNLNADISAKLIIKRVLKTIMGEMEAVKIMHMWEVSKCKVCTEYDYDMYKCEPPRQPIQITGEEWNPVNWDWNRPTNWNWGPQDQYYSRAPF